MMAGETIRDVILNLKIRMDKTGIGNLAALPGIAQLPKDINQGVSVATAGLQQIGATGQAQFEKIGKAATSAMDKASRARQQMIDDWDRQTARAGDVARDRRNDRFIQNQLSDLSPGKNSPTENGVNSAIVGKMRIAADAYKVAGEGAFHLARGIAFLTANSEEELAVVVRRIAYYQGLFDIFKGGTDLIKGLTVGIRAQAAAHAAAAAAATTQNGALATSVVVMNGTTAAATRMWAAMMGPIGWTALAAGVAYAGYQWVRYAQAVDEAELKTGRALKEQAVLTSIAKGRQDELNRSVELSLQFRERTALNSEKFAQSQGLITNISKAPLGATLSEQRRLDLEAQTATFVERRANIAKELANVQAREAIAQNIGAKSTVQSVEMMEQNIQKHKALMAAQQSGVDLRKQDLATLTEQRGAVASLIAAERQRFDANKAALKEEENRKKSLLERFGELRGDQQQQVKDIASQINKSGVGSLSQGQLDFAKQSGFFESALSKLFLQRGIAAGGEDVFKQGGTFLPGTRDRAEGQGENQTREDFLKQERAQIEKSSQDARKAFDAMGAVQRELAEAASKASEQAVVNGEQQIRMMNTAIEALKAQNAANKEQQAKLDNLKNELREMQLASR